MKTLVVIPTYNNPTTILPVATTVRSVHPHVVVVDDGSSLLPNDFDSALSANGIALLRHEGNLGKGKSIIDAAEYAARESFDYILTFDADGQHSPDDIPAFLQAIETQGQNRDTVFIGCRDFTVPNVPSSSKFGRNFSNFWVKLETSKSLQDTQSGFRAYPVAQLNRIRFISKRYDFEIESLVKLLWGGLQVVELPISVNYPPADERISHFRPFIDNLRLSLLHTLLCLRQLIPWPHKRLVPKRIQRKLPSFLKSPKAFFIYFLKENNSPTLLGVSAGVSSFLAVLPLITCHMAIILYVCIRLRLNKVMALAIQNLYMPPLSPFLCIELGFFMRNGRFLTELSMNTVVKEMHLRLWEWLLGSLILAPFFGIVAGIATFLIARHFSKQIA